MDSCIVCLSLCLSVLHCCRWIIDWMMWCALPLYSSSSSSSSYFFLFFFFSFSFSQSEMQRLAKHNHLLPNIQWCCSATFPTGSAPSGSTGSAPFPTDYLFKAQPCICSQLLFATFPTCSPISLFTHLYLCLTQSEIFKSIFKSIAKT